MATASQILSYSQRAMARLRNGTGPVVLAPTGCINWDEGLGTIFVEPTCCRVTLTAIALQILSYFQPAMARLQNGTGPVALAPTGCINWDEGSGAIFLRPR